MTVDVVQSKGYLALASRLIRIGEQMRGHTQAFMDRQGVSLQVHHYPLLASLKENGHLSIGELARNLRVAQPGVTRSVNQLTKQRYVQVEKSIDDQRVRIVELTPAGHHLLEHAIEDIWPVIENSLAAIMRDQAGDLLFQLDHLEEALSTGAFLPEEEGERHG